MEIKTNLKVFTEADVPTGPGITKGQTLKQLAGDVNHPSERMTIRLAFFEPGTHENLHWHMIEAFYYVISGRAVVKDIEGKSYEIGPGSVVYAPPGIAAAHSWDCLEPLKLISIRATAESEKTLQFDVDPNTLESSISIDFIKRRQVISFKKSIY